MIRKLATAVVWVLGLSAALIPAVSLSQSNAEVLSVEAAVEEAVERNHQLRINRKQLNIAERNATYGNADFYPELNAQISQEHMVGGSGFFGSGNIFTNTSAGIQLDWILFAGMGRFAMYDRLKLQRQRQRIDNKAAVEETIAEVLSQFYRVVLEARRVQIYEKMRKASEQMLEVARAKRDSGTGSVIDANLARVQLNEDRSNLEQSRQQLAIQRSQLSELLGRSEGPIQTSGQIAVNEGLSENTLRQEAFEQNRRLEQLKKERSIASTRIEEAKAERWPEVAVGLGYTFSEFHENTVPNFETSPALQYNIGVSIPIFRGFNISRRIDNAETESVQAEIRIDRIKTELVNQIESQWSRYKRQLDRIDLAEESYRIAENNFDIARTQYRQGTINQVELREVQLSLLSSQLRLVEAKYEASAAEITLKRLAGRLYSDWIGLVR